MNFTTQQSKNTYRCSADNEKRSRPLMIPGAVSLMVVFLVLCFVTLAALNFSAAKTDLRNARQNAEHTDAYYAACNQANRIAAELDARLAADDGDSIHLLPDLGIEQYGDILYYSVPMDDRNALEIRLRLTPDGPHTYEVIQWQTVTETARTESTLNLMKAD